MINFEFESDEEEQLEKAVQEIFEKRKRSQRIEKVIQNSTHDNLQILVDHEPEPCDEERNSNDGDMENDEATESSHDEPTNDQDLEDFEEDESSVDSTDEEMVSESSQDEEDEEETQQNLDRNYQANPDQHSTPKAKVIQDNTNKKKRQQSSRLKNLEIIRGGGMEMHRKLTLMDYHGKHKLNITDENIYIHSKSGYRYQIYHKGKVIDKYSLKKFLVTKIEKTRSGYYLCKVHSDCYFRTARSQKSCKPFQNLLQHLETLFATYLCRFCFHTLCWFQNLKKHLICHKRREPGAQNPLDVPERNVCLKVTRKSTENGNQLTLMNSKMKCELNITDEYVYLHSGTGLEYQIYYKGEAMDDEEVEEIVKKNIFHDVESGKLICGIHKDCAYSDPEKSEKKNYMVLLRHHVRYALMIYLCRSCLFGVSAYSSLVKHFKIHKKS